MTTASTCLTDALHRNRSTTVRLGTRRIRPLPIPDLGLIDAVLVGIGNVLSYLVLQPVPDVGPGSLQAWHPIDDVDRQIEPIRLILNLGRVDAATRH